MSIDTARHNLNKAFEGCRLKVYKDTNGLWTIGWGHLLEDQKNTKGLEWTQEQADNQFIEDYNIRVRQIVVPDTINEHQMSAIISFVFNVGIGNYNRSTFKKILFDNPATPVRSVLASGELLKWCRNRDKTVNLGLLKRRVAEVSIFLEMLWIPTVIDEDVELPEHLKVEAENIVNNYWRDCND